MNPLQGEHITSVIGVDPGPSTGIAFLDFNSNKVLVGKSLMQVDGASACILLEAMMSRYYFGPAEMIRKYAQVEEFVTGKGAGTRGGNADITRQLVMQVAELLQMWGYHVKIRKATEAKNKISDRVLQASGTLGPPEMRHSNDAMRHAWFAAIGDAYMENPLR